MIYTSCKNHQPLLTYGYDSYTKDDRGVVSSLNRRSVWGMSFWNASRYSTGAATHKRLTKMPTLDIQLPNGKMAQGGSAGRVRGGWISRKQGNLRGISKRRGVVWGKIKTLLKIWRGGRIRKRTQIRRSDAIAFGAYGYNFSTLAFNREEETKIDMFQNRILRCVTRAPPVWVPLNNEPTSTALIREGYQVKTWMKRIVNSRLNHAKYI